MPTAPPSVRQTITLLESGRPTSLSHLLAYTGSVIAQVALVSVTFIGVSRVVVPTEAPLTERPTFLAPFQQAQPRPVQEHLTYTALGGMPVPDAMPRVGEARASTTVPELTAPRRLGGGDAQPPSEAKTDDASRAFSEIEVDSAAARDPDSEGPVYPPTLMAKGIQGSVLATFVVGVDGRPEVGTFIALESSDTLFALAVRNALPRMKFRAAKRGSEFVRQQVEQRFSFRVIKPAPIPTKPVTPAA